MKTRGGRHKTFIDELDERLDVALLAKNKGTRGDGEIRGNRIEGRESRINGYACRIITTVLQTAQPIEEKLKDVTPFPVHIVV